MAATHKVIILGKSTSGSFDTIQCLFWFDIASGQLARTSGSSWNQATAADNAAIQSGAVLEESNSFTFPAGLAGANPSAVEAYIDRAWTNRNNEIAGVGPAQFANVTESPTGVWG